MRTIELDERQIQVLREVLVSYLSDLRMEVAHTDSKDFRDKLKEKEKTIKAVLEILD